MSSLANPTFRRVAAISTPAARAVRTSTPITAATRAAFSTTPRLDKSPVDIAKDGLKKADRVVADKLVDGIDMGIAAKEEAQELTTGDLKGKAAELKGDDPSLNPPRKSPPHCCWLMMETPGSRRISRSSRFRDQILKNPLPRASFRAMVIGALVGGG